MEITLWIKLKRRKSTKMTETRPYFLFHRITTPPPPTTTSTCYDNEPIFWLILFVSRLTQSSKILYSWSMVRCIKPFVFSLSFVPIHFLFLAFVFDLHVCLCASLFLIFIQKKITVGWQATLVFFSVFSSSSDLNLHFFYIKSSQFCIRSILLILFIRFDEFVDQFHWKWLTQWIWFAMQFHMWKTCTYIGMITLRFSGRQCVLHQGNEWKIPETIECVYDREKERERKRSREWERFPLTTNMTL